MYLKKQIVSLFPLVYACFLLFTGCQGPTGKREIFSKENTKVTEKKETTFEELYDPETNSIPIFYNMYLTVEISSLFEETGVSFMPQMLNPSENMDNYLTSYKKALNIGVFAVDLSYVKVFQEFDYAGLYFTAMHKLAESLGVPDDFYYSSAKRFERNLTNKDSLSAIANEIYMITDHYLKTNNRKNTASLIIVGGWVEAIYLAMNVYNQSNHNMIIYEKIADQDKSLSQVIDLIEESHDQNDYILSIIEDIKSLKVPFDKLSANYSKPAAAVFVNDIYSKIRSIREEIVK